MEANLQQHQPTAIATLGNGCFWCTEAIFSSVTGVLKVTSGYCGGEIENPSYEQVCSGTTGAAECLQITFDPELISYESLLEIFWQTHDPTTLNRQGADEGTQYRSVVFYHNAEQKQIAELYKAQLDASGVFAAPIVTSLEAFTKFYPAEAYHQNYYPQHREQGYCQLVIRPKLEKFRKQFSHRIKP